MDIALLVKLTSRAWALDILAQMHAGVPGRQAALLSATGAGRTAFAASLQHLMVLGLVERNPGHGHPLRPEFRLTPKGEALAPLAHRIDRVTHQAPGAQLLRKTWSVPVLAVAHKPKLFSELKRSLEPITDRALSHTLQSLSAHNWIDRQVEVEQRPPRPTYCAINEGADVCAAIGLTL